MRRIRLTQGKFALVDDDDFDRINAHRWCACFNKSIGGFYAYRNENGKSILMHREVMFAVSGELVDHIHHDTLDNRKSQLRKCTQRDNQRNMRTHRDNRSGFKGVSRMCRSEKWRARITVEGREIALGVFDTPELAATAYDSAAKRLFGEFALTNEGGGR